MQRAPIDRWLYDSDELIAAMRAGSDDFAADLSPAEIGYALLRPDNISAAVLARDGTVLAANPAFRATLTAAAIDSGIVRDVLASKGAVMGFAPATATLARRAAAYATVGDARQWALPDEIRAALDRRESAVVMLAVAAGSAGEAVASACRSFGLTPLQTRVATALIAKGNVRDAAAEAGVGYETAREAVADAMKRAGATRLSGLVESLVRLSFGIWPLGRDGDAILKDVWGLTNRQAELALQIAQGLTRAEAARATGISEALAKKEIDIVYATLEVRTAAELARAVTEARALSLLTSATGSLAPAETDFLEPQRLVQRPDGSQVAFSDYGPASGAPVLIVHSSSASRQAPSRLVRALQGAGFRPLAIDRPGFGLTDGLADRGAWRADPFGAAVADVRLVCERLKIRRLDIIGRGGAQAVVALAQQSPDLIGEVVLVNPDPPTTASRQRRGALGAVKEAFFRFPDLIEKVTAMVVSNLTPARSKQLVLQAIRSSPPDVEIMEDPRNYTDYARGFRLFTTGRVRGYVAEQRAIRSWTPRGPVAEVAHWHVLMSEHDPLHDPAETLAYWESVLPEARFETVPNAGRFLVMSHAGLVAARLAAATERGRALAS